MIFSFELILQSKLFDARRIECFWNVFDKELLQLHSIPASLTFTEFLAVLSKLLCEILQSSTAGTDLHTMCIASRWAIYSAIEVDLMCLLNASRFIF